MNLASFYLISECLIQNLNAHGTFDYLLIKIKLKIQILETNTLFKLKFCMLSIFEV